MSAWIVMLLIALCALPQGMAAQAAFSFHDDFDYPAGNLYKQGGWMRYGGNSADPVQVVDKALTYPGYYDNANGKSVKLGATKSGEDLMARFTDDDAGILSGDVYMSALINVEAQPKGSVYALALVPRTKNSTLAEGTNAVELGRIYFAPGDKADEVKIGVERGAAKPVLATEPLKIGQTYLVVMRYQIIKGDNGNGQDNVYLYVNPATLTAEPNTPSVFFDGANSTGNALKQYGLQGVELRQGTNATVTAPVMYVASVRVADSYTGLFGGSSESETPTLKVSKKSLVCGSVYAGDEYTETLTVTGSNLKGDVSVTSSSDAVTVSPATLSADDVMSGDGAKFNVTIKYTEGEGSATLTLKSEDADDATVKVSWSGFKPTEISTIKAIYAEDPDQYLTYRYTGEAVVTFVDKGGDHPVYYLQDATGAFSVSDEYGTLTTEYDAGDKITGTVFGISVSMGTTYAVAYNTILGKVLSKGNAVEPEDVTLAQLKAAPADYLGQLVRVKGITFKDVAEGATFKEGMTQPVITDGTDEAKVRIFKKTSLIGTAIPTTEADITGLFTSAKQLIIAPRGSEDVTVAADNTPSFDITPDKIDRAAGVVGKTSKVATIHVSAKNMPSAILLDLMGAGSSQFSLSQSAIEKGSSETDIDVMYTPTSVAIHKAILSIDCPSLPELSRTIAFSAYAIDEQNPPAVAITPQTLEKFSAKAGETQDQTIEITTSGMPDYAYVKVQEAGTFRLSNTMLLRNTKNTLRVTFAPKAAGTYTNAIVISALGMDDVTIPIEGVATDGQQTDPTREGDDFKLSTESPLTLLNETFDNQERNKPLHINGWVNSALQGTRAWWGYSFLDYDASAGEKVAKVTAYDSKLTDDEESPAQMMLVTPALDFKNSASKIFTFRVRGDNLIDNQTDKLELCYIDMADGEPYIAPVSGFTMPCTKDESGEWYEYHIDLTGQNIADVFFMGFRFTSTRGHNNVAVYYIDDVTYGRTDIPVIRPSVTSLAFTATPGKDAVSDLVTVEAENLTEPITASLGGPNKSKFQLSHTELPGFGGTFTVAFNSFDEGVHEAYVKLSSRGAADKYVVLSVNNTIVDGIDGIPTTPAHITVYDLNGNVVADKAQATPAEAVSGLSHGVYVVKATTADSIKTYKVRL